MGTRLQFGPFELDAVSGELWRAGRKLRLQDKPVKLLLALLHRPGELVERAELQRELWPGENELDLEDGLNTAVRKLREALGDSAETPQFLETIRRRGYRWIAPVVANTVAGAATGAKPASAAATGAASASAPA
ncbi:MAG: winged helix-turn-helix domain-containing protein, partial [Terriglobales bacterium]